MIKANLRPNRYLHWLSEMLCIFLLHKWIGTEYARWLPETYAEWCQPEMTILAQSSEMDRSSSSSCSSANRHRCAVQDPSGHRSGLPGEGAPHEGRQSGQKWRWVFVEEGHANSAPTWRSRVMRGQDSYPCLNAGKERVRRNWKRTKTVQRFERRKFEIKIRNESIFKSEKCPCCFSASCWIICHGKYSSDTRTEAA